MIVSFSGLDGSGKSLQISELKKYLTNKGYDVIIKTMYFDLTTYSLLRRVKYKFKKKEEIIPKGEISNNWYSNPTIKIIFLLLDLIVIRGIVAYYKIFHLKKIIIFDRYLFDEVTDISSTKFNYLFQAILRIVPKIDLVVFLIVSPEISFQRKKEYNLKYLHEKEIIYKYIIDQMSDKQTRLIINTEQEGINSTKEKIVKNLLK
jgi:thymidylate kinase